MKEEVNTVTRSFYVFVFMILKLILHQVLTFMPFSSSPLKTKFTYMHLATVS